MTIRTSKRTAALAADHLNIKPAEIFDMTPNKIASIIRTLAGGVLVNAKDDRPNVTGKFKRRTPPIHSVLGE